MTTGPQIHPVARRLRAYGVEEIAIIDDAYDAPDRQHAGDVDAFWLAVRADETARAQLAQHRDVADADEIDDELVGKLWEARDDGGRLAELTAQHLFASQLQQRKDLGALCSHLRWLGFKLNERGTRDETPVTERLVFLDYVLDPLRTMDRDALATEKARAIYRGAPEGKKPFIVLMSDNEEAVRQHAIFRQKSELMAGLFGFLRKAEVSTRDTLFLRLATWGIGNPAFGDLQDFAGAILAGVQSACNAFSERIRALDVHDYSFIQRLSLHEEGHPLGDYLMWLFESSLGHALRDDARVMAAQQKLDSVRFETYIPSQLVPSDRLAKFYLTAVTEPAVSGVQPHPQDPTGKTPLLFLGDIFMKNLESPVMLVVTAACDLAYRPLDTPQSDLTQPVYLAPGTLFEVTDHRERQSGVCTELVVLGAKAYRIEWDYKHVVSKPLGLVYGELNADGYERTWRLRLPYALAVQQAFVNHVSRLGLPVPPPLFHDADVQVFAKDDTKTAQPVGAVIRGGAALRNSGDGTEVILMGSCIDQLIDGLEAVATAAEAAAANAPDVKHREVRVKSLIDRASTVRGLGAETERWVEMMERPFKLPKGGNHYPVDQQLLWAHHETELAGKPMGNQPMFLINISRATSAVAAAAEAAGSVLDVGGEDVRAEGQAAVIDVQDGPLLEAEIEDEQE